MNYIRPLLILTALSALLLLSGGCDPVEGAKCDTPGEYYTHEHNGKRVSLSCQPGGIDTSGRGKQEYRWVKV